METRDSFERMATGLSTEERQDLLERLKSSETDVSEEVISAVDEKLIDTAEPINVQIKKESLIFRFFLWLKSVFTNTTIETLYNEYKITGIARYVEKNFPGLLDAKKGMLLDSFYVGLSELKSCADFFRTYVSGIEEEEGAFYVSLSSLVMPETSATMSASIDPYTNSDSKDARSEYRLSLLRKMEEHFDTLDATERAKMYSAVKSVEWLRHFVRLPFARLLTLFSTITDNVHTCPFDHFENDFDQLGRLLCNNLEISDELLESLYMFSIRKNKHASDEDTGREAGEFLGKAHANIRLLTTFIKSIPVRSIGCIVHNDYCWQLPMMSGGEDWFVKYKNAWKKIFEQKWASWEKDCKKEALKTTLKSNFALDEFPLLTDRPWADLWGGIPFRYELTIGFLNWFMSEGFLKPEIVLKTLQTEGSFRKKENQTLLFESFNTLISLSISLQGLVRNLAPGGEIGMFLNKFKEEHLRTLQTQTKVEQTIRRIESDCATMLHQFGEASRSINRVLMGVLGQSKDPRYDTISNLNKLNHKNEEEFAVQLEKTLMTFSAALDLIKELEAIDMQKTKL